MWKKYVKILLPVLFLVALGIFLAKWSQVDKVPLVSDQSQDFQKAKVTEILTDNLQEDGSRMGNQTVKLKFLTGPDKGQEVEAISTNGSLYGATCHVGSRVITLTNKAGDTSITSVYSLDRGYLVCGFVLFFFLLLYVVGGKNGLKAVAGLLCVFVLVLFFLFPAIYRGMDPVLASILTVALTTIISLFILSGYHWKTAAAILGTILGVVISGIAAWGFGALAHISGYNVDNIDTLVSVANMTNIQVGDLLFAGILISSLGAVMDVGLSIASTVCEIHDANPALSISELFRRGMNVGKDMMGTMSNTLILAFTGGSLSELLLDYAYDLPYLQLINSYNIGIEVMKGIAGSIGIILTVPLVSILAAIMASCVSSSQPEKQEHC